MALTLTAAVEQAVAEIKALYPRQRIDVDPEAQGGAYVVIYDVELGPAFTPATSWVGFLINFHYPRADVYPHYIDHIVKRTDRQPLGDGFAPVTWRNQPALQVSRRSNRWDPTIDTAALKLEKVLTWLRTR